MRFLAMVRSDPSVATGMPPQALMDAMAKLVQEGFQSGTLVDTGGLRFQGARVRLRKGNVTVTDGPYAEAKEIIGGYAMVEVGSREEAMKVARDFMELHRVHWPEFEGECEVRQLDS